MGQENCINQLLDKARAGKGLCAEEVEVLWYDSHPEHWTQIYQIAGELTRQHFSGSLQFFAPLYFSNHCVNDCVYCGFRRSNQSRRKVLTEDEFLSEARFLQSQGHQSVLLISGEHPLYSGVEQVRYYLEAAKNAGINFFWMAELAPQLQSDYAELYRLGIKQLMLFQETYHQDTYEQLHRGPKIHYEWRYQAMDRALRAGIKRVGLGILLGLYEPAEDLRELVRHGNRLQCEHGVSPITFSFPRIQPAEGAAFSGRAISDETLMRMIAMVRLAFPESGIVLSTRETPVLRQLLLASHVGVTHLSAGSSVVPGGYTISSEDDGQFKISDPRSLREVMDDVTRMGYRPRTAPEVCVL